MEFIISGLGRTGVLIACYLVYSLRVRANDAIRFVRLKRPNAVQTRGQILCVQEFEQFILPQSMVFCNKYVPYTVAISYRTVASIASSLIFLIKKIIEFRAIMVIVVVILREGVGPG